jgi:Protein of unknown function (DUF2800)
MHGASVMISFSQAERIEACPGSTVYPGVAKTTDAADRGLVLHEYRKNVIAFGEEAALELVPSELRDLVEQYDASGLPTDPAAWATEVAFAIDLETDTARELGRDIGRRYAEHGAAPGEIVGAADYVSLLDADTVSVDDLKTGWGRITRARVNLQLGALAYAAVRAYGRSRARVRVLLRREDGSGFFDEAWLDGFDLDLIGDRLRAMTRGVEEARADADAGRMPRLHEGPWCSHCPARWICPVKMSRVTQLAIAPMSVITGASPVAVPVIGELSPADLAVVVDRLEKAEDELRGIRNAVKIRAREEPIRLTDGRLYGVRKKKTPTVDGKVAHRVIEAFLTGMKKKDGTLVDSRQVANNACGFETSQAAINRALRAIAPPRGLSKLFADTIGAIERAGGITYEMKPKLEKYRPDDAGLVELSDGDGDDAEVFS